MNTAKVQKDFNDAMEQYRDHILSETPTPTCQTPDNRKELRDSFLTKMETLDLECTTTRQFAECFMKWALGRVERGFRVNYTGLFYYFDKTFKTPTNLRPFRRMIKNVYNEMHITQFTIYPKVYRQHENYVILVHKTDKTPLLDLDGSLIDENWKKFLIGHQQLKEQIAVLKQNKISKK
jgi:hypothetical protein